MINNNNVPGECRVYLTAGGHPATRLVSTAVQWGLVNTEEDHMAGRGHLSFFPSIFQQGGQERRRGLQMRALKDAVLAT